MFGLLGVIGGYVGWQMGDTSAQSSAERTAVARFWRLVVGGFVLFLLPAFVLVIWRRSHPWLQDVATLWLGLLYATIAAGLAMYAWRQHRWIRRHEPAAEPAPPITRKRFIVWVALGTFCMTVLLVYGFFMSGDWQKKRVSPAEAQAFIATHPAAELYVVKAPNHLSVLVVPIPENERHSRYRYLMAGLNQPTLSFLQQSGRSYRTLVQGRDFEVLGLPGRLLFVLAFLIVAAGVAILVRTLPRCALNN